MTVRKMTDDLLPDPETWDAPLALSRYDCGEQLGRDFHWHDERCGLDDVDDADVFGEHV